MRCIFCLKNKPSSSEHVFPEAIGGTLVIDRVCKKCNDILGTRVDAPLVDHALVVVLRSQLSIKGKRGLPPDVFADVFGEGKLADDPQQRVKASSQGDRGAPTVKLLYKRTVSDLPDGRKSIQIVMDETNAHQIDTIFQRERKRAGMSPLTPEKLDAEVERALEVGRGTIDKPEVLYNVPVDLVEYQRGILKIAYELAWYWFGDRFLKDPQAKKLRSAMLQQAPLSKNPESHGVRGTITIGGEQGPLALWKNEQHAHLALAARAQNDVGVSVRVFNVISATVAVSHSVEKYANIFSDGHGKFLWTDPASGTKREVAAHSPSTVKRLGAAPI